MRAAPLLLSLCLVPGCASFPEVDAAIGAGARNASYPVLTPLDGLFARATTVRIDDSVGKSLAGRAAALRREARILGKPVLTERERRRLLAAVARHSR